jgi:3'(2'), 5'-bisphosphate nucleotidase
MMDFTDDHIFAAQLAASAGDLLTEVRQELAGQETQVIKDQGDKRSHDFLMQALAQNRPTDGVLSEEGSAHSVHPLREDCERVWIIDPVDGTREYSEPLRTDWAVHVALALNGQPVVGAVALPALGLTLSTATSLPLEPFGPVPATPRVVVSRSRPPAVALAVAESLNGELVEMGSAGAKAMAVVRGEVDLYVHAGGQYEWDNCAPAAVALAAGLHVSRLDGSPLTYNHPDPWLPDLLICRTELASDALAVLAEHQE